MLQGWKRHQRLDTLYSSIHYRQIFQNLIACQWLQITYRSTANIENLDVLQIDDRIQVTNRCVFYVKIFNNARFESGKILSTGLPLTDNTSR